MLTMTQVHDIEKRYFVEGKTISAISKETGFERKTLRHYLSQEDFNSPIVPCAKPTGALPLMCLFGLNVNINGKNTLAYIGF